MIPNIYCIILMTEGARWSWRVEDLDIRPIRSGKSLDYTEACADALRAFDSLRKEEMETRL